MRIISPAGTELTNSEVVRFEMDGGREGIASVKKGKLSKQKHGFVYLLRVRNRTGSWLLHCRNIC